MALQRGSKQLSPCINACVLHLLRKSRIHAQHPAVLSAAAKIRHADAPAAPDKSFDAVLAEVLGDVGGSLASPARPSSYTPAPASTPGAYRRHSGAAAGRTPARHMQALHTPVRLVGSWRIRFMFDA